MQVFGASRLGSALRGAGAGLEPTLPLAEAQRRPTTISGAETRGSRPCGALDGFLQPDAQAPALVFEFLEAMLLHELQQALDFGQVHAPRNAQPYSELRISFFRHL